MPDDRSAEIAAAAARIDAERRDSESLKAQEDWQRLRAAEIAALREEGEREAKRLRENQPIFHHEYGRTLGFMRVLQVVAWIVGVVSLWFEGWPIILAIAIHIGVEIYVVLCDISVRLLRKGK